MKMPVVSKVKMVVYVILLLFGICFYRVMNYHDVNIDTLLNGRWIIQETHNDLDFDLIYINDTLTYTPELEEKLSREFQFAAGDSMNLKKFYKTYDPITRYFYVNHQRVGYLVYVSSTKIEIMTIKYGMIKAHAPGYHW